MGPDVGAARADMSGDWNAKIFPTVHTDRVSRVFRSPRNEDAPIKNKNRKPLIAADLWQIHCTSGTNILLAVNCQGCDLGVRN